MKKNGYFKLLHSENSILIKIYAPVEGGTSVNVEEVMDYLDSNNIVGYDEDAFKRFFKTNLTEDKEFKLLDHDVAAENEECNVNILESGFYAVARFYPPSSNGKLLTKDDIIRKLGKYGIKHGICEEVIDDFLVNRTYCTDIIVAQATKPVEGKEAVIQYHFDTTIETKPHLCEDGSVDFHQLGNICHIKKGDKLATLIPADMGEPGMNIMGNILTPKKVVVKKLKFGKNIALSEDGLEICSNVSGHVALIDDTVYVYNIYDVRGNVDASTGDIEYDGNVEIKGNVLTGYKVTATGNITVEGVVEGAILIAGNDIILRHGVQGMGRGILQAGGNITARFFESCKSVSAGKDVTAEAILHCKVIAEGSVKVSGKKGLISGGHIQSHCLIEAVTVGSHMGTNTVLEIGISDTIAAEYNQYEKQMDKKNEELTKLNQIVSILGKVAAAGKLTADKKGYLDMAQRNVTVLEGQIKDIQQKRKEIENKIQECRNGRIRVERSTYNGVQIIIAKCSFFIKDEEYRSEFRRDGAEIKKYDI